MTETNMTTPGFPGWISHSGPDASKARTFYADVIGWNIQDMPMKDGSSHPAIMVNEAPIGGFSPMPETKGGWTIYVTVDDVDARVEKAKSAGATLVAPATDVPGVGRMATLEDPQGGRFSMITYESMQS